MSTNFYFINRKQEQLHKEYKELINSLTHYVSFRFTVFSHKHELGIEDEINDVVRDFSNRLEWIYEPEEIHICKSHGKGISFEITEYYSTIEEIEDFYNKNKDNYKIEDEYRECYSTWEDFIKRLDVLEADEIKWIRNNFS